MDVPRLVDGLFRREAGRITATLVRLYGPDRLDLAEDVVQEALLKALRLWPMRGVPENPTAWLTQVARHAAVDRLRRETALRPLVEQAARLEAEHTIEDSLDLLVRCCHPALSPEAQAAIVLKTLGGFSTAEIARAFLVSETTVAQRIVRAKTKLREARLDLLAVGSDERRARMDSVLRCLYLMFNEGYAATQGEDLIRRDLCDDAIRLARWLADSPDRTPKGHALLALMLFLRARFDARVDADGVLVPLAEQNPELWDARLTGEAFGYLAASADGDEETDLHLQAAIASEHALASGGTPDWSRIISLYERLEEVAPSPTVNLNAAVARGMAEGPEAGLRAFEGLEPALFGHLFYAGRARWLEALGQTIEAGQDLDRAMSLVRTEPERRFLKLQRERLAVGT